MSTTISAADVKKLRDMTGAGMMDCKAALSEAEGDFEKAIEILRKKGEKLSLKRADRDATEGVVLALINEARTRGVIVKVSCETDFVAKNEDFVAMTRKVGEIVLAHFPATIEAALELPFEGEQTIGQKLVEQIGVIGEKIELASYAFVEAPLVAPYIHMGNRAGVLVGLSKAGEAFFEPGRDVAMQVAAMSPIALNQDSVDPSVIQKEIEIGKDIARNEGKPEEMLEKIAMGKLNKFYKENTLVNQDFVKDNKQTVAAYLRSFDKELEAIDFKHIKLG